MANMPKLVLVKHARSTVDPVRSPSEWELSPEGKAACPALAEALARLHPEVLVTSPEIKACQTADEISHMLNLPVQERPGLHEHDRDDVPHLPTREFLSMMALAFRQPRQRIIGAESLERARDRFLKALDGVLEEFAGKTIAVISHGTVISLALHYHTGQDPYALWRKMQLPSFAVLNLPDYALDEIWP